MLKNEILTLRIMEEDDLELVRSWRFNPDNYDYFYEFTPVSKLKNKQWFESSINKSNEINFIIENNKDKKAIGIIALIDIDHRNRKAEMGRVLIGDNAERSKGFGAKAISVLLNYAFNHLNLNKIYCEVFDANKPALNLYKKIGFEVEGNFSNHIYKNGNYENIIRLAIFKEKSNNA